MPNVVPGTIPETTIRSATRQYKKSQALKYFYRVKLKSHFFSPAKILYSVSCPKLEAGKLTYEDPENGLSTVTLNQGAIVSIMLPEAKGSKDQILQDYFKYAKFV